MKQSLLIELLANIKATFVSFFSILMFVALGVGVFLGINWVAPALQSAAELKFDEGRLHNFQVNFTYGLTEEDLDELKNVEGVTTVEPGYNAFLVLRVGQSMHVVRTQPVTDAVDAPFVEEGTLPTKKGEAALEATWARRAGLTVGDSISFEHDAAPAEEAGGARDKDGMQFLTGDTYQVTALVEAPDYLSTASESFGFTTIGSGNVDGVVWFAKDSYDPKAFFDGYPVVNILCEPLSGKSTFGSEYREASDAIGKRIAELGATRAHKRYADLHDAAISELNEGEAQIAEARQKVAEGERQIAEGEHALEDARSQVAAGEQKLAESRSLLEHYQELYDEGKRLYDEKSAELEAARSAFKQGMALIEKARDAVDSFQADIDAELAGQKQARADADAAKDQAKAERDAAVAAADVELNTATAAAKKELDQKKITQEEYEAKVAKAQETHDAAIQTADAAQETAEQAAEAGFEQAVAESNDRIDATCNAIAKEYKKATGLDLPFALDHTNALEKAADARALLDSVERVEISYKGQKMSVAEARKKLAAAEKLARETSAELDEAEEQLNDGWAQYNQGQAQVESGKQQISEGEARLEEARSELEEGKKKVSEGEAQLEEGKRQLGLLKEYEWSVLSRFNNGGVAAVSTFSGITERLRFTMAALFLIVGLLVSYSAVSRLVHEQITQIGTKKAMGFRRREITRSYLAYSGLAVLIGVLAGALVGYTVVEGIISSVLGARFIMGPYPPYFDLGSVLLIGGLELVLVLGATWFACRGVLKENAVELLKGEKPPETKGRFYERWGIWERLPLFTQTIVNNCVNDKRRVFSTIVGVAGCTALIVTAVTLNDNVLESFERQYSEVYGFNAAAYVEPGEGDPAQAVRTKLESLGADAVPVMHRHYRLATPDGGQSAVSLVVPENEEEFASFYHIPDASGGLGSEGVWMSLAYSTHQGAQVGDEVEVTAIDGSVHHLKIMGFFPHYLAYFEMVMSRELYEREFGAELAVNALFVDTKGQEVASLEGELRGIDGFGSLVDKKEQNQKIFTDFSNVSLAVVVIYLALATLMAIVVLLNLNVMFVEEKKRELITLMINGYSVKDAKRYISRDTVVLTALGIALGLVLGGIMGYVTVDSIELPNADFVKDVDPFAMGVGLVGSVLLAGAMNRIAMRRISRFDLTDINKS